MVMAADYIIYMIGIRWQVECNGSRTDREKTADRDRRCRQLHDNCAPVGPKSQFGPK
jgi:hypothetical protein